jgi:hypothetical protein
MKEGHEQMSTQQLTYFKSCDACGELGVNFDANRKIKIDTASIVSVKNVKYSKYFLNRSVYNLHIKGTIRFYTRGIDAVELTDKDGLIYLIGSQKSEELTRVIKDKLKFREK